MRKLMMLTCLMVLFFCFTASAGATMIQYNSGGYSSPQGYQTIVKRAPIDLAHGYYYNYGMKDFNHAMPNGGSVNIVFHNVYNWAVENNWLSVYIYDNAASLGWSIGYDSQSTSNPNWGAGGYNATLLGTWSDLDGSSTANDVLFTTSDSTILSYLSNGGTWGIGIDPDCHFYGGEITIEAPAPAPEPATMLLFGFGLVGFVGAKRIFRKR